MDILRCHKCYFHTVLPSKNARNAVFILRIKNFGVKYTERFAYFLTLKINTKYLLLCEGINFEETGFLAKQIQRNKRTKHSYGNYGMTKTTHIACHCFGQA